MELKETENKLNKFNIMCQVHKLKGRLAVLIVIDKLPKSFIERNEQALIFLSRVFNHHWQGKEAQHFFAGDRESLDFLAECEFKAVRCFKEYLKENEVPSNMPISNTMVYKEHLTSGFLNNFESHEYSVNRKPKSNKNLH